jgi:hypothetical protein
MSDTPAATKQCLGTLDGGCGLIKNLTHFNMIRAKHYRRICNVCARIRQTALQREKRKSTRGTKLNGFQQLTAESQATVLAMLSGNTLYAVAKYLGKSPSTIYSWNSKGWMIQQTAT